MSSQNPLANYFDYSASTPVDEKVLGAMTPFFVENFYNPSASYTQSRQVKEAVKTARQSIAKILGARPVEIIFTAGGTEANNLAIRGVMEKHPGANMIFSAIEHDSVIKPAEKYKTKILPVNQKGIVKVDELDNLIDDKTVLVSVMLANNEIGTIQPVKKIAQKIESIRKNRKKSGNNLPLLLHTDGAQATNYLDLHVSRLSVDLMSINGGKVYGPKQTGVLYVKSGIDLEPITYGGGQEKNLRSGTENVPGIVGLAKSLEINEDIKTDECHRLEELQKYFINKIAQEIPNALLNGSIKNRLPNNLNYSFGNNDNERLAILLDQAGFAVATGSACSASSQEPSHVLSAIGLSDTEIKSSLRFSMGRFTTQKSIDELIRHLKTFVLT